MDDYLTETEAAQALRITHSGLIYKRNAGTAPRHFKVGRRILYSRADIEAYVADARERTRVQDLTRGRW